MAPVDYKRGKRPHVDKGAWEPERVQLCAQGLILRDNGFECDGGVLYFVGSRERVAVGPLGIGNLVASPVRVGSLMLNQGDLLHGDANGVTNIPTEIAGEIADITPEFIAAETIVLDYVRGKGEKTVAGMVAARKEFSAVVGELTERAKASR